MSKKQKKMLIRIIVALVVFIACEIAEKLIHLNGVWDTVVKAAMFAVPYLMAGYDVLLKAIKNISKGHVFDENFLMAVATVGAYGTGEFGEAQPLCCSIRSENGSRNMQSTDQEPVSQI